MSRCPSLLGVVLVFALLGTVTVRADTAPPLSLQILSSRTLNGTAGDYVTVRGAITNTGDATLSGITTYLSLVDLGAKLPVDLEDWSAEKGQYIGAIGANQTFPLDWKIHFVKAGEYSLIIIAETAGESQPQVSEVTQFHVAPKKNLDPAQVLPVALGMPILLVFALFLLAYRRKVDE